jgi:hypothetical protein
MPDPIVSPAVSTAAGVALAVSVASAALDVMGITGGALTCALMGGVVGAMTAPPARSMRFPVLLFLAVVGISARLAVDIAIWRFEGSPNVAGSLAIVIAMAFHPLRERLGLLLPGVLSRAVERIAPEWMRRAMDTPAADPQPTTEQDKP